MYIFNHIPKCGGLSYRSLFENIFGKTRVTHISLNLEEEYRLYAAEYREYELLMGHFGVRWNDVIGPGRRWMTALREPVDRVVSCYYFWRNNAPVSPDAPWLYLAQTKSLDDFVRSGNYYVRQGIENLQTWQLADDLRWRYHEVSEADALEVAKENLEKFGFVGLHEEMERSIEKMCRFLGTDPPRAIPHVNPTARRDALAEIEPATVDAIRELNRADLDLYAYARKLFYGQERTPPRPSRSSVDAPGMLPASLEDSKALQLRLIDVPSRCAQGNVLTAIVEISNAGEKVWSSGRPNPLFVSYHWYDDGGQMVIFDGWRSEIHPLQPLTPEKCRVHIVAPPASGNYTLRVTFVQEGVRWFDAPPLNCFAEIPVTVENARIENAVFSPGQSAVR